MHVDSAKQEVTDAVARLKSRYDHLVKATISASIGKEKDRALIYASRSHPSKGDDYQVGCSGESA